MKVLRNRKPAQSIRGRSRAGWSIAALALGCAAAVSSANRVAAQGFPVSKSLSPEARQFDFWVGTWDVNLRVQQEDLTWAEEVRSAVEVYPILRGKAILELWSDEREKGIKGYSLRSFDPAREEWVLWLNWPDENRSGSSSLSGSFRHGRGEFFSTRETTDGGKIRSRYTFSDITPESLRWDDAFSRDGGKTWTHNWIMEFTRSAKKPELSPTGGAEHTFHDGSRCSTPEFRRYEFLSGRMSGPMTAGGSGDVVITGHQILDGCALLTFAGGSGDPETAFAFSHITWNTYAKRYELTTLTSGASTPTRMFYSRDDELVFYESVPEGEERPADRFLIQLNPDNTVTWQHAVPDGEGWSTVWEAKVARH